MNYFKKFLFLPSELTTGFEYNYGKMTDKMLGYGRIIDQKVNIGGAFIQNEWKNKNLSLLFGVRADKHNLIDNFVFSPRANIRYTLLNDYIFRLSYSTGYRPPQTFDEDLHVTAVGGNVVLMKLDPNLKPEYSKSISGSFDIIKTIGNVKFDFLIEGFYTRLEDAFVLQEAGVDSSSNIILERRNGPGANVKGINLELRVVPTRWMNLQAGFTLQNSKYESPYQWSKDSTVSLVDKILRSPDNYGYVSVSLNPVKPLSVALTGTYTGSMLVPHFAGYISSDKLETTDNFFALNMKLSYDIKIASSYSMEIYSGIENIFNSFQKDFDKGKFRDAGYVYGPFTPRTFFAGIKVGIL
jgi:outer membrane receptor for ferrienterochelin and colicins